MKVVPISTESYIPASEVAATIESYHKYLDTGLIASSTKLDVIDALNYLYYLLHKEKNV